MEPRTRRTTLKRNRSLLLLALIATASLVAACGGGGTSSDSSSTAAPAASDTAAASSDTAAASTEAASTEAASTEEASTEAASTEEASTEAASTDAATSAPPAVKKIKVGLVTDIGGLNDKGFNALAYQGLQQAQTELGAEVEVRESKTDADYVPNLSYFAQKKYDLVIAVGFLMAKATGDVAKKYPGVQFAIIDNSITDKALAGLPNATGLLFKEQEAGYLVGFLAGSLEKAGGFDGAKGKNTISSVGGLKIPPVDRYIAGFQAGAAAADPGIKTINGYSNEFVDQAKCSELAKSQIDQGADVVFQVAGGCGLGALKAAKDAGVWGIGVDNDQSAVNDRVLASAIKKVDQAVFLTAKALAEGSFEPGKDVLFGLAEGGVGIAGINAAVPQDIQDAVTAQEDAIKAGSVDIPTEVK